jgi:hypothetical protein
MKVVKLLPVAKKITESTTNGGWGGRKHSSRKRASESPNF